MRLTLNNFPWLVAGDMNEMVSCSEKREGAEFNFAKAASFARKINSCNLINLGFHGSPFTWMGKRQGVMV